MTHVCALLFDHEEGVNETPEYRILLSDREISPTLIQAPVLHELDALARAGKLQGVLLRLNRDSESNDIYGTVLFPPANPYESLQFFTVSGLEEFNVKADDQTASGEVAYTPTSIDSDESGTFSFKATFKTALSPCPPVSEKLEGPAALASAPVKALFVFQEKLRSGDLEGAAAQATAGKMKEIQTFVDQAGKEAFLEQVKQFVPDTETLTQQIRKVFVRGASATVIAEDQGTNYLFLVKEGEAWKVN
ncbi:MAG: hypothetical protein HYV27_04065 [Candidatus Hydrogenedentes bacterium]|nr:hypothetical protein [Candidatus Hydrogenedentota bacterium]